MINSDVEGQINLYSNIKNGTNSPYHRFENCYSFVNVYCDMPQINYYDFALTADNVRTFILGDNARVIGEQGTQFKFGNNWYSELNEGEGVEVFNTNKIEVFEERSPFMVSAFQTLILNKSLKTFESIIATCCIVNKLIIKSPWVLQKENFAQSSNLYSGVKKELIIDCQETNSICAQCFYNMYYITSITISDNVENIGNEAFNNCYSVKEIHLPLNLKTIGNKSFYMLRALNTINLPEGLVSIGASAFLYAESLTTITIPTSITSIAKEAFYGASSLASVVYNGTAYTSKSALTTALTDNGVTVSTEGAGVFGNTALTD